MPKLLVFLFGLFFVAYLLVVPQKAAASGYDVIPSSTINNIENNFLGVMHLVSCVLTGNSVIGIECTVNTAFHQEDSGGLLTFGYGLFDVMYTSPPLSSQKYIEGLASRIGVIQEAHAQVSGSGSQVISTIFLFWETSRNLAYIILALVFVLSGLFILLGQKMGQSVVTIQAALPNMVISLILITFSYFIAAVFVDMTFLGSIVVGNVFSSILKISSADPVGILNNFNLINIYFNFIGRFNPLSFVDVINALGSSEPTLGVLIRIVTTLMVGQAGAGITQSITGQSLPLAGPIGGIIGGLIGAAGANQVMSAIAWFILVLALVASCFRLIMDLLKRYIAILFLVIFAPILFSFVALPGNNKIFYQWCKDMLCNTLPFPAVFGAFYFASYFLGQGGIFQVTGSVMGQTAVMPLFGGFNLAILNQIIGVGILLAIPAIPAWVCKRVGGAIDSTFGAEITAVGRRGMGSGRQIYQGAGNIGSALAPTARAAVRRIRGGGGGTGEPPGAPGTVV